MSEVVDRKTPLAPAASSSSALVSDTRAFLVAWRRILSGSERWIPQEIEKLREQSRKLQERARAAGVGGLAHHLGTTEECFAVEEVDRDELSRRLRNVSELTSQLRQEIDAGRAPERSASSPAGPPRPDSFISFPPRPAEVKPRPQPEAPAAPRAAEPAEAKVTAPPSLERTPPSEVVQPLPAIPVADAGVVVSSPAPREPSAAPAASAGSDLEAPAPLRPSAAPGPSSAAPVPPAPSALPRQPSGEEPAAAAPALRPSTPPAPPAPPAVEEAFALGEVPPPAVFTPAPPPAFFTPAPPLPPATPAQPSPSAEVVAEPAPALPPLVMPPADAAQQIDALLPKPPRLDADSLSIEPASGRAASPSPPPVRVVVPPIYPPKRRAFEPLPALAGAGVGEEVLEDLDARLDRIRKSAAIAPAPPSVVVAPGADEAFDYSLPRDSERQSLEMVLPRRPRVPWWSLPIAAGVLAVLVVLGMAWRQRASSGAAATSAEVGGALPGPRLTEERESLRALLAQVHGHGGPESPELADLLDEEAALVARSMEEPCTGAAAVCEATRQLRESLLAERAVPVPARPAATGLGAWLSGLKLPGIGVRDDAKVREIVEYHTQNNVGREKFQVLLFQCGAYQDLIEQLLLRHGLPLDLMALTMVESGCVADAESPVGARGLWQFMPATARAYHLRVRPGLIDERISPPKSTDAALKFLGDLRRKLGSWELAMASYNMGPFGLIARLRQAGGDADYWALADAGRLPAETAAYVPKVQAYAVILANLSHFGFEAAQLRAPEVTAELEVPAGTRLGLVARAAGSSTTKIRELNPDLLGDSVPDAPEQSFLVRIPKEGIWRARESLPALLADSGHADRCVPHSFDWGRQRFTKAMAERCEQLAD